MIDVIALPAAQTRAPKGVTLLAVWHARSRERAEYRRLLRTGAYLVRDIGLVPERVAADAAKPFWRE